MENVVSYYRKKLKTFMNKPKHYTSAAVLFAALLMSGCTAAAQPDIIGYSVPASARETAPESSAAVRESGSAATTVTSSEPTAEPVSVTAAAAESTAETLTVTESAFPAQSAPETPKPSDGYTLRGIPAEEVVFSGTALKNAGGYAFEFRDPAAPLLILGPNLVWVGEEYPFDCLCRGGSEEPDFVWSVSGDCASVSADGTLTALAEGVCTLSITDKNGGESSSVTVHCVKSAADVDFIPAVNNFPIANKTYPLPADYDPGFLPEAEYALLDLIDAAAADGISLFEISTYRSYSYQQQVYAHWRDEYGADADLISARPGHSEHQLGLAADLNMTLYDFADTKEGKWLKAHCAEYGFILRYPSFAAREYTGYNFEPWHIRYVGVENARKITDSGLTLEQLLGIDSRYR